MVCGGEVRLATVDRLGTSDSTFAPSPNDGQGSARDDGFPRAAKFAQSARMLAASACWSGLSVTGVFGWSNRHLARLLGRGRAMEAILGADDFDAETAERYGWVNRALPDTDLDAFVARLARRIASFPADGVLTAKQVLNEVTMPAADAIRADAVRFRQLVAADAAEARTATLFAQGLQTRGPLELNLGDPYRIPLTSTRAPRTTFWLLTRAA